MSQAGSIRNNTTGPAEKVHSQPMHYTVRMMPEAYSNLVDLELLYAAISVIYSKFNKGQVLYECDWCFVQELLHFSYMKYRCSECVKSDIQTCIQCNKSHNYSRHG